MGSSSTGEDVVARAKAGDQAAWRELYVAHAGRLVVWLRTRYTGVSETGCDDLAAEAWLTAASKIADFSGGSSDFAGWLFAIARNLARNSVRRETRRATWAADAGQRTDWLTTPDPAPEVVGADWTRWMLAQLPQREAEIVACIDVAGLDIAATSRALGISPAAVRVGHYRGLRRLRRLVASVDNAESPVVGQELIWPWRSRAARP